MTSPTTRLPPTTNEPNALITLPASPCTSTRRVTLTLIASRNSDVRSKSDGKTAKSSARFTYMVETMIASAPAIFSVISRLSSPDGSGMIIMTTTSSTAATPARSLCFKRRVINASTTQRPLFGVGVDCWMGRHPCRTAIV